MTRGVSLGSGSMLGRASHEADWDDAWDSSSDKEDHGAGNDDEEGHRSSPARGRGVPIPNRSRSTEGSSTVAASWASTSFQHVSHPSSSSPPSSNLRPALNTSKTYTDGAVPPAPGTTVKFANGASGSSNGASSKLPPGGAWEIVEPSELNELHQPTNAEQEEVQGVKVGKEAIREDIDDVLRGEYDV